MNEVEKMYSNANLISYYCGDGYIFDAMLEIECTNGDKEKCKACNKAKINYPPFTAEKQIELIKWFAHKAPNGLLINKHITDSGASMVFDDSLFASTSASSSISFEECLANLVNNAWVGLLDAERKQIKEILE